jgi:glycosyltransferase involved in cell wall biosynthesis
MKLSLVCCTLGDRPEELERMLAALAPGPHAVELIVVDQSADARTRPIVMAHAQRFDVKFVQCRPGLSRARNAGLEHVTGDVLAFPDDDCWYRPDTITRALEHFEREPSLDALSGRWLDEKGKPCGHPWPADPTLIDANNVWRTAISFTIFVRTRAAGGLTFDPLVGVGSGTPIGAGEETLYLLKLLAKGAVVKYVPDVEVNHPWRGVSGIPMAKAYRYAVGFGYVVREVKYPPTFIVPRLFAPLARGVASGLSLDFATARYHFASGFGRAVGVLLGKRLATRATS